MTAAGMLAAARKSLGLSGRPNYITRDYSRRHGSEFLDAPWCDMSITYWARVSGNTKAVLPDGDRAFTVWHAEDGRDLGRWYPGTATAIKDHAEPGAIVFFDWDGSNTIGRIDHVGLVEKNLGDGRVQTIEGNTGNACKRRIRGPSVIAGFWNPPYKADATDEPNWTEALVKTLPTLRKGDKGWHVKTLTYLLLARDYAIDVEAVDDTVFTDVHVNGVKGLQAAAGIEVDGVVGQQTWPVLLKIA